MKTLLIPVAAAMLAAATGMGGLERASLAARTSHDSRYVVSAIVETADHWRFHVVGADGAAVNGAKVYARASMPETGQAGSMHLRARELGQGDYRVDGVRLDRAGWWNVALIIASGAGTDSVAFNVTR